MSTLRPYVTTPKAFQQDAIANATIILSGCLNALIKVRHSPTYLQDKRRIVADQGALLFEAPTGTGKTLMIGHVVEALSKHHPIIWLWFSPFAGLTDQATKTIRTEFPGLRPRNPTIDRDTLDLKSGDVYVTTWASVAVANVESRKVRTESETTPSLDSLLVFARSEGFSIGVVIDEAHHSFRGQSQAFTYYKDVLQPELTLLATATPRDVDIEKFCRECNIPNLRRTSVSRQQGVDAGLIKPGVKVAVFKAPNDVVKLIDFKRTALRQGIAVHRKLKELLDPYAVVPLLLVQVDSSEGSVSEAQTWLKSAGFTDPQIRTHTADEPDPDLMSISADENVQVLIFKMSVATGFDVPRAFTLVSFRPARDTDFGVQVVGRILRVDRRLQVVDELPSALNYGYVFLSDNSSQGGLASAAERINAIQDELASVTENVTVAVVGDPSPSALPISKAGQMSMLTPENDFSLRSTDSPGGDTLGNGFSMQPELMDDWKLDFTSNPPSTNSMRDRSDGSGEFHHYPLRDTPDAPLHFQRSVVALDQDALHHDIIARFEFSDDLILKAQQMAVNILMEEVEIFGNRKDSPESIRADLAQREIDVMAQRTLFAADDLDVIDIRELTNSLLKAFRAALDVRAIDAFDTEEKLLSGLNKILALRPGHLKKAISEAIALHTEVEDAAPIPKTISSIKQLAPARLNLYSVYPDDLNTWERNFAEYLDNDTTDTVKWWHRNPVRKPFSVSMPLPGQPSFYPDFIVGVKDRKRGNGILLAETKRIINDQEGNAVEKAQAEHPVYKKVMMLYWQDERQWLTVEYDEQRDMNYLDKVLRPELLIGY